MRISIWILALTVVNMVIYIPVAVATLASIPKMTKTGQKILPGPMPQKEEAKAPKKAIPMVIESVFESDFTSPLTKL